MIKKDEKIYTIQYESLLEDPNFPKSRWQLFRRLMKNTWSNIKKSFPKSLITTLIFMLVMFIFYVVYLSVIVDTFYLSGGNKNQFWLSIRPYIMPGVMRSRSGFRGFSHLKRNVNTLYVVLPFIYLATMTLKKMVTSFLKKGAVKGFFGNLFSVNITIKKYKQLVEEPILKIFYKEFIIAFVLGFLIKNPFTILLLSILLFLSVVKNNKSELMLFLAMLKVTNNIKKNTHNFVSMGNIAFSVLGLSVGFFLNFIMIIPIWFFFNYSIWARGVFTLLFVALFIFASFQSKNKQKQKQKTKDTAAAMLLTIILCGLAMGSQRAFGDDGGWTESGSTIAGWFANPGSKLLSMLGLSGSAVSAAGFASDLVAASVYNYFGVDAFVSLGSLIGGFGKPTGSAEANLTFAKAGLGPLGPLGEKLGSAVGGINDAMSGKTDSGGSGSSGGGGGSNGGTASYEDMYGNRRKRKTKDDEDDFS